MVSDSGVLGWQTGPARRGTLEIIQNCLFTIFACTWSIQHLNIPGKQETWRETLPRKIIWTALTILFPEFIMAHAIFEFKMAVDDMVLLEKQGLLNEHTPWWFPIFQRHEHASWWVRIFRRPSGTHDLEAGKQNGTPIPGEVTKSQWTLTHCYFANMGGFYINCDDTSARRGTATESVRKEEETSQRQGRPSGTGTHLLTAQQFVHSREHIEMPNISEYDLKDKSKTDYFTKAIAVIQIAQLVISLIVRQARHLAYSQLEALTLAFAICGVLTYLCSWYKPKDIQRPIEVKITENPQILSQRRTFDRLWHILIDSKTEYDAGPLGRIHNDNVPRAKPNGVHFAIFLLAILTAAFGAIHAIAWNFEFPSTAEQEIWRTATLISIIVPPAALLAIPLSQILRSWGKSHDFICACIHVLREYSWQTLDNKPVQDAMKALRVARDNLGGATHYRDILGSGDDSADFLGKQLLIFLEKEKDGLFKCLPGEFEDQFNQLIDILQGLSGSKRLSEAAQTDTYPQRAVFGMAFNRGIIYVTGIVYCIARVSLLGVAFSSLRLMPNSVYTITWVENIPSIE